MKFNEKITAYFLANARLTFLAFTLLILFAVTSTLMLKTTGFPSPEVNFAAVQTPYIGAASETVLEDVTIPLEGAIKNVDGVKSYSSKSLNSFSMINLTLDENEDQSKILSDLSSAIATVQLPTGAEEPEVIVPDIAGSDFMFSVVAPNHRSTYETYQEIEEELNAIPETSKVNALFPLERSVVVRLDSQEMAEFGITMEEVQGKIQILGLSIPVAAELDIDDDQVSVVTSTEESSLETLKELPFGEHELTDFATVSLRYDYEDGHDPVLAYQGEVMEALTFELYAAEGADMKAYTEKIEELLGENEKWIFLNGDELPEGSEDEILVIENFSVNEQNALQVKEVLSGIVGGPLPIDSNWKYLGYALGGIQLVFLVMTVFVSWRAALVAALAIPLSLVFSNIYLFLIGESLNTLVLFSFVLVVGLVVDPALVLLEGVQRKLDAGFRGKTAALEAVKDVGNGLFLATLNNIIVFFPFAVVSGILGQIIWYIPLTIMPALVGSYIVPLIFLTWLGSFFLKAKPHKTSNEMENLWGISKAIGKINRWILNTPVLIRGMFIIVALVVPVVIAGALFGSGQVKSVQFSGSKNADYLMLSGTFLPSTPEEDRELLMKNVLETMAEEETIEQISQAFPDLMYYVTLKPAAERKGTVSSDIAEELNKEIQDKYGRLFFDIQVGVISNGPPTASYQIALSLKSEDLEELEDQALALGSVLEEACMVESEITFAESCSGDKLVTKVDDGYTNKTSTVIEVLLKDDYS
ncbi:MAG: efflux RND transporter permease subunit, partial [Patescibacteria group bacterium]